MTIKKGNPLLAGSTKVSNAYNFTIESDKQPVKLMIYNSDKKLENTVLLDDSYRTGNIFSCEISDVNLDKFYYAYEVDEKQLIDPYAKSVYSLGAFGTKPDGIIMSRITLDKFDWEGDTPLNYQYSDCIFYKLHVRGFTKSRTSGVAKKGTFAGAVEKIPHLLKLGITTVELMPAYEYDETGVFKEYGELNIDNIYKYKNLNGPVNYWGYVNGFYFAPKYSFTSISRSNKDYTVEFKNFVKEFHKNGIEVVMEMYFYDKTPEFILDCIKYWVNEYHIDGVHLYGDEVALKTVASSPLLSDTKIITVYWDGKRGAKKHMANCNSGFADTARKFLKCDDNQLSSFVNVSRNNPDNGANINYICNHNGFTLNDLVSYDRKHNEANGENNRDGEDYNYSWNCGEEGPTRKKKILQLRKKQIKNALTMLMMSAGTPLIMAGDEMCNSQNGNNNPYCLDEELSWVSWKNTRDSVEIFNYLKELIAFRKKYNVLHMPKQLIASDTFGCGYPDVSYHGSSAWYQLMENYNRHIGIMYCSKYGDDLQNHFNNDNQEDNRNFKAYDLIYIAYNMHWESHELALPNVSSEGSWEIILDSAELGSETTIADNKSVVVGPRTSAILLRHIEAKKEPKNGCKQSGRGKDKLSKTKSVI